MHAPTRNAAETARMTILEATRSFEVFAGEKEAREAEDARRVTDEVPAAQPRMENDFRPRTPPRSSS